MILQGIENQKVELKVVGKQFPNSEKDSPDLNWLNIFLNVQSKLGNWETIDTSLTTAELRELINWFRDLSKDKKVEYKDLYFTEPNLEFDLIKEEPNIKHIKMILSAESKPKSAKDGEEFFMEFRFTNEDLSRIASDLETELKNIQ